MEVRNAHFAKQPPQAMLKNPNSRTARLLAVDKAGILHARSKLIAIRLESSFGWTPQPVNLVEPNSGWSESDEPFFPPKSLVNLRRLSIIRANAYPVCSAPGTPRSFTLSGRLDTGLETK